MSVQNEVFDKIEVTDAFISEACTEIDKDDFFLGRHDTAFSAAIRRAEKALEKARTSFATDSNAGSDEKSEIELELRKRASSVALLQSKEAYCVQKDRSKALRLIDECVDLGESTIDQEITHKLAYEINKDLGKKDGMLKAANELLRIDPNNTNYKVLKHNIEEMDEGKLKREAFKGSWKIFAVFGVVALAGLNAMTSSPGTGILMLLIAGGGSYWYWKSKSE